MLGAKELTARVKCPESVLRARICPAPEAKREDAKSAKDFDFSPLGALAPWRFSF